MAERGAPKGNNNAGKNKLWRDALDKRLREFKPRKDSKAKHYWALQEIADKVIEMAMAGDMQAIKEIGDRVDGKAPQSTELIGDSERPLITKIIQEIVHVGTDSKSS